MHPMLALLLGLVCAGIGGELFVRGAVGIARMAKIPAGIIGATIAAFATSSPEVSVSVTASVAGTPQIALGDALGSNVVNIGLVLGLALLFGPLKAGEGSLKRDIPFAVGAPLLTTLLVLDGTLSRLDAAILGLVFLVWLVMSVIEAKRVRDAAAEVLGEERGWKSISAAVAGLALLILAGTQIVVGAKYIGDVLGWNAFVVGATLVAIGTSMPELATTVISRVRGHDEVGLGTVIGSNIFNGLFIVTIAALITPITVKPQDVVIGLGFGVLTILMAVPGKGGVLGRWRGGLLLAAYGAYVVALVLGGS